MGADAVLSRAVCNRILGAGFVSALALSLASAASAVVLPQLDPVAIDTTFLSTSGSTPAAIDFVNHLNYAVNIYWIDYSGDRVFYNGLAALSHYVQGTYLTHPWIVAKAGSGDTLAQGTGTLITGFLAQTPSAVGGPDIANIGAVPEPASWALMIAGFGMVGGALRRRTTATA
jgi:hypothetical protein